MKNFVNKLLDLDSGDESGNNSDNESSYDSDDKLTDEKNV